MLLRPFLLKTNSHGMFLDYLKIEILQWYELWIFYVVICYRVLKVLKALSNSFSQHPVDFMFIYIAAWHLFCPLSIFQVLVVFGDAFSSLFCYCCEGISIVLLQSIFLLLLLVENVNFLFCLVITAYNFYLVKKNIFKI